jgi:hypothetical protein
MSSSAYSWLVALHGHLSVLGLAVLMHPIVTLRSRSGVGKNTMLTAELAAILLSTPFFLGWVVYPTYRARVKPMLFLSHPDIVLRFETKEHLGAMAVALVVAGAVTLRAAGRRPVGREAAWSLLLVGWVLALLTAALGVLVHGLAHPGF